MKIPRIELSNVLALHRADIAIPTPILMLLGNNEAGKSSLRDAISMALLGDPVRVKHKKYYGQILHDDAKKGRVSLITEYDEVFASFTLPAGEHTAPNIKGAEYLPYVINPVLLATMDDKELRALLFKLTACKASPDVTAALLLKRGARAELVEEVKPLLRGGFAPASKDCAENATKAKGAYRALTGENWGSIQSAEWEFVLPEAPDMPDVSPAAIDKVIAQHAQVTRDIENGVKYVADAEARAEAAATFYTRREALEEAFDLLPRAQGKLKTDEKSLVELETAFDAKRQQLTDMQASAVPVACPCCNELLRITGQTLEPFKGLKADTAATSTLALEVTNARAAIDMLKRAIANDIAAVTTAKDAGKALKALDAEGCPEVDAGKLAKAQDKLTECRLMADKLRAKVEAMKQRQEAIDGAAETTATARKHHQDVVDWLLISDALKPDGIPSEILATALKPVNDSLAILSRLSGWKKVQISRDMEITADGRIYGLMSESAKWRIDTLLALMVAQLSGLKFVVLDRFDVLDIAGRGELVNMLLDLADMGSLDQAIVCGTAKQAFPGMPPEVTQVFIQNAIAEN